MKNEKIQSIVGLNLIDQVKEVLMEMNLEIEELKKKVEENQEPE